MDNFEIVKLSLGLYPFIVVMTTPLFRHGSAPSDAVEVRGEDKGEGNDHALMIVSHYIAAETAPRNFETRCWGIQPMTLL
jgi:hypothetical protein